MCYTGRIPYVFCLNACSVPNTFMLVESTLWNRLNGIQCFPGKNLLVPLLSLSTPPLLTRLILAEGGPHKVRVRVEQLLQLALVLGEGEEEVVLGPEVAWLQVDGAVLTLHELLLILHTPTPNRMD